MTSRKNKCWYPGCDNYWTMHLAYKCRRGFDNRRSSGIEGKFCDDHVKLGWKDHKNFVEGFIKSVCE